MRIHSIDNINFGFCSKTEKENKMQLNSSFIGNVAPYTLENMQANYLVPTKVESPTLKSVLKKHNLPQNLLRKFGYKKEAVSQEMVEVFDKLNPKVVEHIQGVDKKGDIVPKLLTKTGEFESFWDYKGIPNLLNLFNQTTVNGETLLSQLDDFTFVADEDFDVTEWELFINLFDTKKDGDEKTYLERFLGKSSFKDLFYSKEFSPSDILEVRDKVETSMGLGSFVPNRFFQVMDLVANVEGSKYSPIERTQALNYFISLEDKNGEKIFNVSNPRHSKISIYNHFMNVDPSSVEASNIQMLIELVQQGIVGKHVFEYLPLDGKVSSCISTDIDKLYNAYVNGVDPIDEFIPTFDSVQKAHKQLKTGDVYELEGEEKIYIINNEDSSTQLQITKQKCFELFPPIERFGTTQNQIGNCWEISVLQGIYSNPRTRHMVLNLFKQQGNDLIIEYPKGGYGEVLFENGNLPSGEDLDCFSQGAKGFQLLEYADGKEVQDSKIKEYVKHLIWLMNTEPELAKIRQAELEEMIDYYGVENLRVEYDYKEKDWIIEEYKKELFDYPSVETMVRDGGYALNLLMRLGFKRTDELMLSEKETEEFLNNPQVFERGILIWTTKHDEDLCESRNLTDGHAYFLSGANFDKTGKIIDYNLINPWGIVEQCLTFHELKEYGSAIIYGQN